MKHYVGLDVSQEETHICVIDEDDRKLWQGKCESTPEAIGKLIQKHAPAVAKIGLEISHTPLSGIAPFSDSEVFYSQTFTSSPVQAKFTK